MTACNHLKTGKSASKHSTEVKRWSRSRKLLSRSQWFMDGHELSKRDNVAISEMLYLWAHVIYDISCGSGLLARNCSVGALTAWLTRLALNDIDIKSIISTLKWILSILREYNAHNGETGVKPFRRMVRSKCSTEDLYDIEPVWHICLYLVRCGVDNNPELFRSVNTLLQFPVRLTLRDVDWIEEESITAYLEFEDQLKSQAYPDDIIQDMNAVARDILRDFTITEDDFPVNGNGATEEAPRGSGETVKFRRMRQTWMSHQMDNTIGYELPWWLHLSSDIISDDDLASRYQLVPKGIDKKRGVSLEPSIHMYYQQMVFRAMDRYFHQHPELNICLQKQEFNRGLAAMGSAILNFGTADLSSASDSVTISLVKEVFKGTPLLPWLLRTRTRYCDVTDGDGNTQRVTLEKFAPMGSALCFPVECLIFSLVIQVASKRAGVHRYYRVYGDDMIIHRDVWDEAIEILNQLHFIVNMDKSFAPGSEFTESCGIECLNGFDVSPMRLSRNWQPLPEFQNGKQARRLDRVYKSFNSRKLSHRRILSLLLKRMSPEQLCGQVQFLNRLLDYGLYHTARQVYKDIRRYYGDVLLGDADASNDLADLKLKDDSLSVVLYNRKLQRLERVVTTIETTCEDGEDSINYYLTLQTLARRTGFRLYQIDSNVMRCNRPIQAMPPEMVCNRKSGSTRMRIVRKRVPMID